MIVVTEVTLGKAVGSVAAVRIGSEVPPTAPLLPEMLRAEMHVENLIADMTTTMTAGIVGTTGMVAGEMELEETVAEREAEAERPTATNATDRMTAPPMRPAEVAILGITTIAEIAGIVGTIDGTELTIVGAEIRGMRGDTINTVVIKSLKEIRLQTQRNDGCFYYLKKEWVAIIDLKNKYFFTEERINSNHTLQDTACE